MDAIEQSLLQYIRSLINESDRGCVILVAISLDEALKELHRTYIKSVASPPADLIDKLCGMHGPLSSFAARIQLGYAYGLIENEAYKDLEQLRKLRNDAAHVHIEFSFRSSEVRNRVLALQAPKRAAKTIPGLTLTEEERRAVEAPDQTEATAKLYFLSAGMALSNEILLNQMDLLRLKSQTGAHRSS